MQGGQSQVCYRAALQRNTNLLRNVEIISQGHTMTTGDFKHLVFAVAVESSPLDTFRIIAPVEKAIIAIVANAQLPTYMRLGLSLLQEVERDKGRGEKWKYRP